MKSWHRLSPSVNLFVQGRIEQTDALRQEATAREVMLRLARQPGLVLADEVGMGKTFVALAIAASIALGEKCRRPVVIMVPSALKEKWPRDYNLFQGRCLTNDARTKLRVASAATGVEFLKLLDDPPERRNGIIFLTHGAMSRQLTDPWVKLAVIRQALYRRKHADDIKRALTRYLGKLLFLGYLDRHGPEIWEDLLAAPPREWVDILVKYGAAEVGPNNERMDDPVPESVVKVLERLKTDSIYAQLDNVPRRDSTNFDERVKGARQAINDAVRSLWQDCIAALRVRLPLLILDEAHHLKNDETGLASLFRAKDASDDAEEVTKGALAGVFERMLFLTATPFQLGHAELCSVLRRFNGIAWNSSSAPAMTREIYTEELRKLQSALDKAQEAALRLDFAWGRMRSEDLAVDGSVIGSSEEWWATANGAGKQIEEKATAALGAFRDTALAMQVAEASLKPWVVRHLRSRILGKAPKAQLRRREHPGRAILIPPGLGLGGLHLNDDALLPFLLAARASLSAPEKRPVFAEGLASSYEAFLETRKRVDLDTDDTTDEGGVNDASTWYLDRLTEGLSTKGRHTADTHPKIAATARRVLELWKRGEKVVVFCHFVRTGYVLRRVISRLLRESVASEAAVRMQVTPEEALDRLDRFGQRFFDVDSPVRLALETELQALLDPFPSLVEHRDKLVDVARRFVRTPSFLVRYFPVENARPDAQSVAAAFAQADASGVTMRQLFTAFFDYLDKKCGDEERAQTIDAVHSTQTGAILGRGAAYGLADDEQGPDDALLLPNVRLVNGRSKQETRQRLMLTFNSPFFPEILIASAVMAEGVDLHRFCRHVIHHDLCWNPSTLEQRTGRVDRIGAKVEICGEPVEIFYPYLAATQDEKQYRVVMDRARWFSVVMGEKFSVDAGSAEAMAERIPLPLAAAEALAFKLHVFPE